MSATVTNQYCVFSQNAMLPGSFKSLESKCCENCLGSFVRPTCCCKLDAIMRGIQINYVEFRCGCSKYCPNCIADLLLPVDLSDYKDTLPTSAEMSHRTYLPHYDDSMRPTSVFSKPGPKYGDWKTRLREKFLSTPEGLTLQQIAEVIGVPNQYNALSMCRVSFPITAIAYAPRVKEYGRPPRIYAMVISEQQAIDHVISQMEASL